MFLTSLVSISHPVKKQETACVIKFGAGPLRKFPIAMNYANAGQQSQHVTCR